MLRKVFAYTMREAEVHGAGAIDAEPQWGLISHEGLPENLFWHDLRDRYNLLQRVLTTHVMVHISHWKDGLDCPVSIQLCKHVPMCVH